MTLQLKVKLHWKFYWRGHFYRGRAGWTRNDFDHLDMFINIRHNCAFQENSKKVFCE